MRSVGPHVEWVQGSVHLLKFGDEHARAAFLGRLLLVAMADLEQIDALCPIPLHPRRLRERGYNQSGLLAAAVSFEAGLEVVDALVRIVDTGHQVGLDAEARATNVVGAFDIAPGADVGGRHVALIDDVVTTGSTATEAARVLLRGGAATVSLVTVSRA